MAETLPLQKAYQLASEILRAAMHSDGFWEGYLASSALATATALSALALGANSADRAFVDSGISWLDKTQNADGGWGDTPDSPSNLATSLLVVSARKIAGVAANIKALEYLGQVAGSTPEAIVAAVRQRYGSDRTFAVPILMQCALAGMVPWDAIPALPFELAVLPHSWYKTLRLQVVSYALPALISVGLLLADRQHPGWLISRYLRRMVTPALLRILERIQPQHGGFLDATPAYGIYCDEYYCPFWN